MPRVIWKGAISFGLVHVPVAMYPASQESGIDFDWLDKRSMDPVGYKRINKRTGKEIDKDNIVKGIKQDDGEYVILSDEEIATAYPKSTQTIDIESFIKAREISFAFMDKPYFLTPVQRGEKVYALLREAMLEADVIGIARVVMHTKEHLAALVPAGESLMLHTIRWQTDLRPADELSFPPAGKTAAKLKPAELEMAKQLIDGMTQPWKPADYDERFTAAINRLAAERVKAGKTHQVTSLEDEPAAKASNVVDLSELLRQSLGGGKKKAQKAPAVKDVPRASADKAAPVKAAAKKKPAARKRA